ncbi:MAG TPA: DUF72 domain-containing protein [Solirubrobacteraceae bacterium]|nr:DUF72 domain-containing protein [Solirubrobacteraceae bacterium]
MAARIVIGTCSWADAGFVADWYPKGLPAAQRLPFYAERFEGVEINSSFYAVPERAQAQHWAQVTPAGFSFDVKLHRLLSRHAAALDSLPPELRDEARTNERGRVQLTPELERGVLDRVIEAVAPLERAGKLRALLLQLSPAFSPRRHELAELDPLIERLAPRRVAIELRNRDWVGEERVRATLDHLADRGAVFVCVDAPPGDHHTLMPPIDAVTRDDLAYVRAHGRNTDGYLRGRSVAERFGWVYSDDELNELAGRVRNLAADTEEVRVMFNNNRSNDAPLAARRMREIFGQPPGALARPEEAQLRLA